MNKQDIEMAIEYIENHVPMNVGRCMIEALERQIKLQELGFTDEVMENYKVFEDECIKKGFTFKSLIEARERQIPKELNYSYNECYECSSCYSVVKEINEYKNGTPYLIKPKYCDFCGQKLDWS